MVSIKDVAEACGVSASTVSKALNNHSDVSENKKQHIRNVAKEMGYSPSSSARMLKTNRSHNIGILFVEESHSGLTHYYFSSILDSFREHLERKGYDLTFIVSGKNKFGGMTFLEHSRYRRFDGVMIACVEFDNNDVQNLMKSDIPTVIIDYVYNNTMSILSDNVKGMTMLTQYAIDLGHRRIAYLHGEKSLVTSQRLSGYYVTMDKNGIHVPEEYVHGIRYRSMEDAAIFTKELLKLKEPPTCILYPDDYACFGGINVLRELGYEIGKDISIAGYDGMPIARQVQPVITTVIQDTVNIGRRAAEKLVQLVENPRTTIVEQITVECNLFKGETIARIN